MTTFDRMQRTTTADDWHKLTELAAGEIEHLERYATLLGADHGDHDAKRAEVLDHLHRLTFDLSDERYDVPDWIVATRDDMTRKRSNSGRTAVKVTRRGKVHVTGDRYPLDVDASDIPPSVLEHAITEAHRNADGTLSRFVDTGRLAAIATAAYDLPDLLGSDRASWSEATPEIPLDAHEIHAMARHTCGLSGYYGPHDADYATPTNHAMARRGWMTYRRGERQATSRPHVARRRLTAVRPRKSESAWRTKRDADGVALYRYVMADDGTERVIAPRDTATCWIGHENVPRGPKATRKARKPRTKRASRNVKREPVALDPTIPLADALAGLADSLTAGQRAEWTHRGMAGTITMSDASRYSVTLPDGRKVRGSRTIRGLLRAVRRITEPTA